MPRGVYDRSKTKAQRETEKKSTGHAVHAAPAAKVKGKPGRKPGSGTIKAKTASPAKATASKQSVSYGTDALSLFSTVRANLETLTLVADKFGHSTIPALAVEVSAHVDIISNLRKQVFGTNETQQSTETVAEAAQAPSNGISAAPQYQTSVPMPPAPIPSIPTAAH